jgi:hypothetical protein
MPSIADVIALSERYDIHAAFPMSKSHTCCGSGSNYLTELVLFVDPWQAPPEQTYRIKQLEANSHHESQHCLACSGSEDSVYTVHR